MATNADKLREIAAELANLHGEYEAKLQPAFVASINQQKAVQKSEEFCEKQVKHFIHNIQPLRAQLNKLKSSGLGETDAKAMSELQNGLEELSTAVQLIKRNLPAPAGKYLYLILGSVRVSMPSKQKLLYKIEYENFKLVVTWALLLLSLVCLFRGAGTKWDPVLMFGLVWFYCTLTIRESILKANGSNISGWWRIYHFLATGLSGVIVLWADKPGFQNHLRTCFLAYTFVVLVAHQLQYRYQAGTLYRLQVTLARLIGIAAVCGAGFRILPMAASHSPLRAFNRVTSVRIVLKDFVASVEPVMRVYEPKSFLEGPDATISWGEPSRDSQPENTNDTPSGHRALSKRN